MNSLRLVTLCLVLAIALGGAAQEPGPMHVANLLMQEAKWEQAEGVLEKVVKDDPKNALAWMQLTRVYDEIGEYDKELDAAQKAIDAGFQAPRIAMINIARALARKGDSEAALKKVEEVAVGGPNGGLVRRLETTPGFDALKGDPRWAAAIKALTPCASDEYRQFDFWLGDFRVEDPRGNYVGDNEITLHLGGCMLMESWQGLAGMNGMSMNFYEPADGTWNQIFVDNNGTPSAWPPLKGKLEDGSMVLWSPEGERRTRWTWTKISDDKVRQMAESTADGGKTWQVVWDSTYVRKN
jgi:tetratricopeptide (TPR) repeat protein